MLLLVLPVNDKMKSVSKKGEITMTDKGYFEARADDSVHLLKQIRTGLWLIIFLIIFFDILMFFQPFILRAVFQ